MHLIWYRSTHQVSKNRRVQIPSLFQASYLDNIVTPWFPLLHKSTHSYTRTFLYTWDVGNSSHGLYTHIQNTSQMKYSPSKRRQITSHLFWKPSPPLPPPPLSHSLLHTQRYTLHWLRADWTRAGVCEQNCQRRELHWVREMRGAPAVLKDWATVLHTLNDENIEKQDKTQRRGRRQQTSWCTQKEILSMALRLAGFYVCLVNLKHFSFVMWGF